MTSDMFALPLAMPMILHRQLQQGGQQPQQQTQPDSTDGIVAILVIMLVMFIIVWIPSCCIRMQTGRRSRALANNEAFQRSLRIMLENGFANMDGSDMSLEQRREYVANVLRTKRVLLKKVHESKTAGSSTKDLPPSKPASWRLQRNTSHVSITNDVGKGDVDDDGGGWGELCSICLNEYQNGDEICFSHNKYCPHMFHRECISTWLLTHEECPCCRNHYLSFVEDDVSNENRPTQTSAAVEGAEGGSTAVAPEPSDLARSEESVPRESHGPSPTARCIEVFSCFTHHATPCPTDPAGTMTSLEPPGEYDVESPPVLSNDGELPTQNTR